MYHHLTTCDPPRPSLGKRIDLSEYRDPVQHVMLSPTSTPISVIQPTPVSTNPVMTIAGPVLPYTPVTPNFPSHSQNPLEPGASVGEQGTSSKIQDLFPAYLGVKSPTEFRGKCCL